ncbi:MAG: HPr family phosphocarrier protein [Pseudomonadota bacterium]|nr:HPr family phosphocarrier protein [Pseudomonadota bacterium]
MKNKKIIINNKLGLHARAAAKFVRIASGFQSEIMIHLGNREVSGKSIMGIMMLAAGKGTEIGLVTVGPDEDEAMTALENLIINRFGEAE